jgi:uncharacterized protein YdaU (DUF1376 family)
VQPKTLFYMPWVPRDFRSSTIGWPLVAKAVYRELLDAQWDMGTLPSDPQELRAICGASESEWAKAWPKVAGKFPENSHGRQNEKLEHHRASSMQLFEKRRNASEVANRARWGSDPQQIRNGSHQSQSQYINPNPKSPEPLKRGSPERKNGPEPVTNPLAAIKAKLGMTERAADDSEIPF